MPSDSIAELPVIEAATNLVIAISVLPANAARMTGFEPDAMCFSRKSGGYYSSFGCTVKNWDKFGSDLNLRDLIDLATSASGQEFHECHSYRLRQSAKSLLVQ